jgi:hypothetical protein
MSPGLLLAFVVGYFALLLGVAWWTSRHADNDAFFIGNRSSHWMLVAFGMVGTSLSGVTFISVPGAVGLAQRLHLPADRHRPGAGLPRHRLRAAAAVLPAGLTSIYGYLARLGPRSYRTGAGFFIVSRTLGATARLYLVVRCCRTSSSTAWACPSG